MDEDELIAAAGNDFNCVSLLSDIRRNDIVIYRYSLFPFALDQQKEIYNIGAKPINTYNQHRYVADLGNYVADLRELTPATWDKLVDIPEDGPFILKGETNSRKSNWSSSMFAKNKQEAGIIYSKLCEDGLIGQQKIYIRQYIPLVTYLEGIGGMPITKEFRFFVAYGEVLSGGYYWQNYVDDLPEVPDVNEVPKEFLQKVIDIVKPNINFFVIDVAQTQTGDWIVIELNDGSQSGLSCNEPHLLYSRLKKVLSKQDF